MRQRASWIRQPVVRLLAVAFGLVAFAADWPWGDLQNHTHWSRVAWIPFVSRPVTPFDILQNLLLFAPFGCFVGLSTIGSRRRGVLYAALLTTAIGFAGEASQLYSHSRFPSATDLTCNVVGAALAAAAATAPRVIDALAQL
jgi:glycopeptide antibiotics resistance protein